MKVGSNDFVYEEVLDWARLPEGLTFSEVVGVDVDSLDRVYVFARGEHPVVVFDREGNFLDAWGEKHFTRPHNIFIGSDDHVYCVDDRGHAVRKFTAAGELLLTIKPAEGPSDTGYVDNKPQTVQRAGPPFNRPTDLAISPEGDLYVSDGYGNARVHKFSPDGRLMFSWGEPGEGPGQFALVHGVYADQSGTVYVADRLNKRIQIFDPNGEFISQWSDVHYPNTVRLGADGVVYVAELGAVFLDWPKVQLDALPARITIRDTRGKILTEWSHPDPRGRGRFFCPHGIAVDSHGDVYVGEIPVTYTHRSAPQDWPALRKYVRQ